MTMTHFTPRDRGLDHTLFPFRTLRDDSTFSLPDNAKVGLSLTVVLQRFHLETKSPFPVPGTLDRPYPDLGNAAQREVGLRSGLWRISQGIEEMGLRATFVVEQDALDLLDSECIAMLQDTRHAVFAGGKHATVLHSSTMEPKEERKVIRECRDALEQRLGREVKGWRSPYSSQSAATLDLLAEEGFTYCGDFNNDDRPYLLQTKTSPLVAVPMHHFSSDLHCLFVMKQPTDAYFRSFARGVEWLVRQAGQPSMILPMVIHPWITGAPHRYRVFRQTIDGIAKLKSVVSIDAARIAENYAKSVIS